jgi:cyclomaltodextrinase
MPQVNVESADARRYLIDAAVYWLERGADGFRLDYANGPTHAFWSEFRAATRAINPDSVTIGEIVETAELQRSYQGRLDGNLDFLLLQQFRSFFAFESVTASEFDHFLRRHLRYFPADYVLPSFLDNHDMNRFLWIANGDKRTLKLAAICQFTLPHPPIVYYGTEIGLNQARDLEHQDGSRRPEESRVLMPSEDSQDRNLRAFFTTLIALRRSNQGLWAGTRSTLTASNEGLYAVRIDSSTGSAIVVLNRSDSPQALQIPHGGTLVLRSESVTNSDNDRWLMAPYAGAVFVIKPDTG